MSLGGCLSFGYITCMVQSPPTAAIGPIASPHDTKKQGVQITHQPTKESRSCANPLKDSPTLKATMACELLMKAGSHGRSIKPTSSAWAPKVCKTTALWPRFKVFGQPFQVCVSESCCRCRISFHASSAAQGYSGRRDGLERSRIQALFPLNVAVAQAP